VKRTISLALAAIMVLALLTACQGTGTPATSAPTTGAPATAAPATSAPASGNETLPQEGLVEFNDKNVAQPGEIPVLYEPYTITIALGQDSSYTSWTNSAIGDWVKEKTNVDIVWDFYSSSGSEARQAFELLVASNSKLPDVVLGLLNDAGRDSYGESGYLVELTPYFEKQGKFFYDKIELEGFNVEDMTKYAHSPDGGLYGVPTFNLSENNYYSNRAWIATPFLEALNMKNPSTADELYNFLLAVKTTDLNGNGKNDEIGIIGSTNGWNGQPLTWLQNMFIYRELTDDMYIVSDDGYLDVSYDKPEYLEFLKYARMLCDEGLLDPLSFTQNYDTFLSQVTADELIVAMPISGGVGGFGQNVDKYQAANVIKGPNGLQVASYAAPFANTGAYITADAESPEACFAFLMVGFLPEYDISARYGVEGLDWEYTTGGEKGMYSALGYDPEFKWLRGDIRQITDQTSVWGGANVTQLPVMNKVGMLVYADVNDPANRGAIMTADITAIQKPYAPKNVVTKIIFTKEESDLITEQRANIRTYVKESASRFVAGDLDPEKDWDAYLAELNKLNYQGFLEIARTAYERTTGK
jgi:putative aldouronate transport system substrate-binding protein